jgi:hypothetical protein
MSSRRCCCAGGTDPPCIPASLGNVAFVEKAPFSFTGECCNNFNSTIEYMTNPASSLVGVDYLFSHFEEGTTVWSWPYTLSESADISDWVRGGGKLFLFASPYLDMQSWDATEKGEFLNLWTNITDTSPNNETLAFNAYGYAEAFGASPQDDISSGPTNSIDPGTATELAWLPDYQGLGEDKIIATQTDLDAGHVFCFGNMFVISQHNPVTFNGYNCPFFNYLMGVV